jgi:hypothetical protein
MKSHGITTSNSKLKNFADHASSSTRSRWLVTKAQLGTKRVTVAVFIVLEDF